MQVLESPSCWKRHEIKWDPSFCSAENDVGLALRYGFLKKKDKRNQAVWMFLIAKRTQNLPQVIAKSHVEESDKKTHISLLLTRKCFILTRQLPRASSAAVDKMLRTLSGRTQMTEKTC